MPPTGSSASLATIFLTPRESHECFVYLSQQGLQIVYTLLHVRRSRQEFQIDELLRDFRDMFSRALQHRLGLLDHTSPERLRLLRPLLEISLFAREFLWTTKVFHVTVTRIVRRNLNCRKILDGTFCVCSPSTLAFSVMTSLVKLCDNLFNRQRHQANNRRLQTLPAKSMFLVLLLRPKNCNSLLRFSNEDSTQTRQTTVFQQFVTVPSPVNQAPTKAQLSTTTQQETNNKTNAAQTLRNATVMIQYDYLS